MTGRVWWCGKAVLWGGLPTETTHCNQERTIYEDFSSHQNLPLHVRGSAAPISRTALDTTAWAKSSHKFISYFDCDIGLPVSSLTSPMWQTAQKQKPLQVYSTKYEYHYFCRHPWASWCVSPVSAQLYKFHCSSRNHSRTAISVSSYCGMYSTKLGQENHSARRYAEHKWTFSENERVTFDAVMTSHFRKFYVQQNLTYWTSSPTEDMYREAHEMPYHWLCT